VYPLIGWISASTALVALHILANVVWIGALMAIAILTARARLMTGTAQVGALARRLYLMLATPAFVVSFGAGLARLLMAAKVYAHLPWMHAKLSFALGVIALHHIVGAKAKRVAAGDANAGRGAALLGFVAFVCAAGAVLLAVAKSLP
jgi:putative membrane protein